MKSHPKIINVLKVMGNGLANSVLPSYLAVGQRHFEKEKPIGSGGSSDQHFILPVDLVALTLPADVVAGVESVEMVYRKKA